MDERLQFLQDFNDNVKEITGDSNARLKIISSFEAGIIDIYFNWYTIVFGQSYTIKSRDKRMSKDTSETVA